MDVETRVAVSGIVHLIIREPGVRARLRRRPDQRAMLEARLRQLGDAFSSAVTTAVCYDLDPDEAEPAATKLPFVPRLPLRVSSTPLYVSALGEVAVQDEAVLRRADDGSLQEVQRDEPVHVFDMPQLPVLPGHTAIGLLLPMQYTRDELHQFVDWIYQDHELIRRWQLERWRRFEQQRLSDTRDQLDADAASPPGGSTKIRRALRAALDRRIAALDKPLPFDPPQSDTRLSDHPFRDLWCVREFLRGTSMAEIARQWDRLAVNSRDLVAESARRERAEKKAGGLSRDTVRRSLRRWLGVIGENPTVRADRTAPGGYREFCPLDSRLATPGEVVGPSMCGGLEGEMHDAFHEDERARSAS